MVAIPGVGAGCGTLGPLARRLAEHATVYAANLPGRQARHTERPRTEFLPLVTELADALPGVLVEDRPYTLVGYCAGALLAFGLLDELRRRGARLPDLLIPVSYPPPDRVARQQNLAELPSSKFWDALVHTGTVSSALAEPRFRAIFEPVLRADMAVVADYRHVSSAPRGVPISVVAGNADTLLRLDTLAGWARYSAGTFAVRLVPGGHALLETSPEDLAIAIRTEIGAC